MYIILIDINQGQKVAFFSSEVTDKKEAILSCVSKIRFPRLGIKSISKIKKYLIYNPYKLYNITKLLGVHNVYYISLTINGVNIDANIIKTKKGNTDATYTIVAYFKEGTYISQNKNIASISAIKHWARYLSWHYYSKEERAEIRKNIYNIKELNETLKDLVWNFECSILGNSLKVYIVKS